MTPLLAGIHDIEGMVVAVPNSWILDTVSLYDSAQPHHHPLGINAITRLNWGYGSTGTLPTPAFYSDYVNRAVQYVLHSSGCSRWIVGNEPNVSVEWPNHQPIYPIQYAACYLATRTAIHSLDGHGKDEVLIAAPGPWNVELSYGTNPTGDWIRYFTDVIDSCSGQIDGFSIHSYTHGYDVALVTSEDRMNPPFQNRHFNFRSYQDYCNAIPNSLAHLPIYITEANGNGPWQAVGLMPAMVQEIADWNLKSDRKIYSCIFYRYPRYDMFAMEGNPTVVSDYLSAAATGLHSPERSIYLPSIQNGGSTQPPAAIDPRATARGVMVTPLGDNEKGWRVIKIQWYDEAEANALGPNHHIMVDVLDEAGKRIPGISLLVSWPSGYTFIGTEEKPGEPYSANYPMSPSRNEYSVQVLGELHSEVVTGIGMGADTPDGFNAGIHTTTGVIFQRSSASATTIGWVATTAGLNLRVRPVDGEVLAVIPYGAELTLLGFGDVPGWRQVRYGSATGWVASQYVGMVQPESVQPEPPTDNWTRSRAFVRRWEGGFQKIENDKGNWTGGAVGVGELKGTKYGISAASYPHLDIENLTMEQADAIYLTDYWQASGASSLPWPGCLVVFDTAVLHGVGTAKNWLQIFGANPWVFAGKRLASYPDMDNWNYWGEFWVLRVSELLLEAAK